MTFEKQYISADGASFYRKPIIMNKNQTLFVIADDYTYIFSMENGIKYNSCNGGYLVNRLCKLSEYCSERSKLPKSQIFNFRA
ncbi:unnamed protein product [Rhizophagus irregularis]|nr:unnamed protein product [Rhizophagus irregularis]